MDRSMMLRRNWQRRAALTVVGLLLVGAGGAFIVVTSPGFAGSGPVPVPSGYRATIISAAKSCPALTPSRLAGQIMEESEFDPIATSPRGGVGLGGLTDEEWALWRPTTSAGRDDPAANIVALAHLMCDLVGHLRVAKVVGDPWALALAAYRTSVSDVAAVAGTPASAREYVENVVANAAWYAQQVDLQGTVPALAGAGAPPPTPSAAPTPGPPSPTSAPTATAPPPAPTTQPTTAAPPRTTNRPPATTPAAPLTSGNLVNPEFGCLSATAALDGTQLTVASCDRSLIQQWQATPDGRIHAAGLCMDAANAGTADWTRVQVAYCSNNPAQLFRLDSARHLYSPYADKCVNVHWTAQEGTSVVLYSCLNQPNQYFSFQRL